MVVNLLSKAIFYLKLKIFVGKSDYPSLYLKTALLIENLHNSPYFFIKTLIWLV